MARARRPGLEVERSIDGTNYVNVANLAGNQTSMALTDQPNGELNFRVRALTAGTIGSYETAPSSPAEVTANRTLQFNDSASEMFSFDVNVTAYLSTAGGSGGGSAAPAGAGSSGGSLSGSTSLLPLTKVMRITVNPLTKQVSTKML